MIKKHIKSDSIGEKGVIYTRKTCYFMCVCAAWVKAISYFPRHVFGGHILKAHSSWGGCRSNG